MRMKRFKPIFYLTSIMLLLVFTFQASAYVIPMRGGDQKPNADYPMIMPLITIDASNHVQVMRPADMGGGHWQTLTGAARPVMWPLADGEEFDPAAVYYDALNDKAYNWQYGWASSAFDQGKLPSDCNIFIEMQTQTPGLNTYERMTAATATYDGIFGTDGSSNKWIWNEHLMMIHNAYAVTPAYADWSATYKIYVGYSATGLENIAFGSDTVTLTWASVPEPGTIGLMSIGLVYLLRRKR